MEDESEVTELGVASIETKGLPNGVWTEQSVLPWKLCRPGSPGCPNVED